jgi:hypothetical protein
MACVKRTDALHGYCAARLVLIFDLTDQDETGTVSLTSVNDYHSTLSNTAEERRCHQHLGGSLKSPLGNVSSVANTRTRTELGIHLHMIRACNFRSVFPLHLFSGQ